jgi:hypothetical protein
LAAEIRYTTFPQQAAGPILLSQSATVNGRTLFSQVGVSIDATVTPDASGRFKLAITITIREERHLPQIQQLTPGIPAFRNLSVGTTLRFSQVQPADSSNL